MGGGVGDFLLDVLAPNAIAASKGQDATVLDVVASGAYEISTPWTPWVTDALDWIFDFTPGDSKGR